MLLTIGQLAKRTGETIRTLRYYNKIGLLEPSDYTEGGHRLYSVGDLNHLQQIQSLKFIGISLKDIGSLLESQQINHEQLSLSISFKKRQLIAQQEEIQRTINKLNHMDTVINDQEHIDLRAFCFILHSILWEENNLFEHSQNENSIYNFTSTKRVELDKEYFSLFTELKQLVTNKVSPESNQAMIFIKKLTTLQRKTLSKTDDIKTFSKNQAEQNILDPFTEEERTFLKNAFAFITKE